MKGWYIPSRPDEGQGDSTAWYASFWGFCTTYLNTRFGTDWCLSPEQSISLHTGDKTVPEQLLVRTPKGRNKITSLAHGTSILEVRSTLPDTGDTEKQDGLRLFSLASALVACAPGAFEQKATGLPNDIKVYLKRVEEVYVMDAYHSLSIEGYRVSPELIKQVRSGNENPDINEANREHHNALAARGYHQAFQAVKESVGRVLKTENPGTVLDEDHGTWSREMFAPNAVAGIVKPTDLAGYRSGFKERTRP